MLRLIGKRALKIKEQLCKLKMLGIQCALSQSTILFDLACSQ